MKRDNKWLEAQGQLPLPTPVGRAITDEDVLNALAAMWPLGMSRKGVASSVGRHVTPTIINRLERLVDEGKLLKEIQEWPNRARGFVYYYRVSEDTIE